MIIGLIMVLSLSLLLLILVIRNVVTGIKYKDIELTFISLMLIWVLGFLIN